MFIFSQGDCYRRRNYDSYNGSSSEANRGDRDVISAIYQVYDPEDVIYNAIFVLQQESFRADNSVELLKVIKFK